MVMKPSYEELEQRIHALEQSKSELETELSAFQEEMERLRFLAENMGDIIWVLDKDLNTTYVSPSITRILGFTPSERKAQTLDEMLTPDSFEKVLNILSQELEHEQQAKIDPNRFLTIEVEYYHKNKSTMWAENRIRALRNAEGDFNGVYGVSRDITDRKKAEAALRASKERYQLIVENITNVVWTMDMDFKNTFVSPSAIQQRGYTPDEIKNQPLNERMTPDSLEKVLSLYNEKLKLIADGDSQGWEPVDFEVEQPCKDGSKIWTANTVRLVPGVDNQPACILGTSQDITRRKQAEKALQESQAKYAKIFNENPVAISLIDLETRCFLEVNKAFEIITGYSKDDLVGKNIEELSIVADARQDEKLYREIRTTGSISESGIQFKKKDGSIGWGYLKGEMLNLDGKRYALTMMIDISDQKSAEDDLEFQANLLSAVKQAVIVTDTDGKIIYWNPFAEELYLWPASEAVGRNIIDVTVPRLSKDQATEIMSKLSQGETWNGEFLVHNRDGELFPVQVTDTPIFDERNQMIGIIGVSVDITKQKKIEEQLRQAQKMEAIGTLAGGIAHDFNNILTSIIGFTELALDEVKPDTSMEDNLQEIYTAGKRAKDLVWQILTFARQTDEPTKPIQVEKIVHEVLKFMRSSIPTSIEIKQNIESNSLIMGNPTQIHQIIMNLCTNAAQAMNSSGGTLMVSLKDAVVSKRSDLYTAGLTNGNYVELKVSDTGTGMGEEVIGSIFEPYFTTKDPGEGTGMGLAVVQGIVEKSKGKIIVESQVGRGATFRIYLPVSRKRKATRRIRTDDLPTGTERILLVDDEAPIAKMGGQILERLGYAVSTRTSSVEALALFKSKPNDFDLLITDMTMPNMTGDELAMAFLAIRPELPVILCTGYSKKISDESAADIGIKAFAYKPIVKADLARTVRQVLDDKIEE